MVLDPSESPPAVIADLGVDFLCMTTGMGFDPLPKADHEVAGRRFQESFTRRHGVAPRAVVFAGQVHGVLVEPVPAGASGVVRIPSCDGLCTADRGTFLVIRTADCLPLVLVDAEAGVCAALHAGWRGTMEGMLAAGVAAAEGIGAQRHRLHLWIGPCIRGDVYEVSEELAADFRRRWGHLGEFTNGRLLDLPALTRLQAKAEGISADRVVDSGLCTFAMVDTFYSHRRQGWNRGHEFTVCGFAE